MKLSEVKPNPENPRVIKDASFEKLCKSITEFPKMMELRPMVTDSDGIVLGGNMRLKALHHLGYKDIPDNWVVKASDLTTEEQRRFIIADNVSGGEWDIEDLAANWDVEELDDWGLELDWPVEIIESEEDNYEIPDTIETDIVLGDLFEIGEHRLLCGDSTDSDQVVRLMNAEKANMVFTDPPHDFEIENYISFLDLFCNSVKFILHNDKYLSKLSAQYIDRFERYFVHDFIFHIGGGNRFFSQNDLIACFDYNSIIYNNLNDGFSSVVRKMTERQKGTKNLEHPHKKPIYLIEQFLVHFSKESDIILDLFLGSGTTMVSSHQLNRKCYGMELDTKYCQVIIDRMKALDPSLEIKRNGELWH